MDTLIFWFFYDNCITVLTNISQCDIMQVSKYDISH